MNSLEQTLKQSYGIKSNHIESRQGGWAALAYEVSDGKSVYFLKVYEKSRASTPKLTALIDQYSPILVWLEQETDLAGKIPVPLLTKDGNYKCEDKDNIYLLYKFINGQTIGEDELSEQQILEFSNIIATLHSYGEEIPVSTKGIIEDFDIPFLEDLEKVLHRNEIQLPRDLRDLIVIYKQDVIQRIQDVKELSIKLKSKQLNMSLCHFDLHNWNLMQAKRLMLIDWEGLKIAPVEADIMFLTDKPYFNEFMSIYKSIHEDYTINQDALQFYKIKRNLEDIWEFIEQILFEDIDSEAREEALSYLNQLME
ncbi:aminoglycoside phosphotransferase family protein [Bacillus horti]|uniref:Thiamine kinase-like enzyme n=1 Tax=Caldalkalibacillus horti TaxID=77523 RepID=A0ABT9W482_9BACI|nr:aminoglycoside phosphotransferase family protein [Bacillus horti]MDQ0167670.1 thiamine kinase-like enzyme [Bacillus horti]